MPHNHPRFHQITPQNGPLMTNHIELQDLDLELELLKRKRQMIEQQQQQLANARQYGNQSRNYNYIESAPQQQYNSNQNFSHNFGQSGPSFNRYEDGQGTSLGKRPSDSRWNTSSAPKRLSGPSGGSKKKFGAGFKSRSDLLADRPAPFVNQQGPFSKSHSQNVTQSQQQQVWNQLPFYMGNKYTPPSQRFNSTKSRPTHTDFRPNKINKPKGKSANLANKLVSYPIPKRNTSSREVEKKARKAAVRDDFILLADKVPSQQVAGRLELALGSILKDVKRQYSDIDEYKASFLHHVFLREVKQAIRERLRTVMLGKHVGKVNGIVEHYRNVFPLESDKDIVDLATEVLNVAKRNQLITNLEETDSPENYFKLNMNKLLDASLDEMFKKLQKLYGEEREGDGRELFNEILESSNVSDVDIDNKDMGKIAKDDKDKTDEDSESKEYGEKVAANEKQETNQDLENANENVETAEPKLTLEQVEAVKSEQNPKDATESDQNPKEATKTDQNNEMDNKEKSNIEDENVGEKKNNENISKGNTEVNASNTCTNERFKKMETFISNVINRKMSSLLPKYKFHIMKVLRTNYKYIATEKLILSKLEYKLSAENQMKVNAKESAPVNSVKTPEKATPAKAIASTPAKSIPPTPALTPTSNTPYFVKVHGRPNLPKKAEMQTFLQKFRPKTVKKHRSMQLLFVGFDKKEDYDKMVAIQETTIDGQNIIIKASEIANRNQKPSNVFMNDDDVQVIASDTSADSSANIIGTDLDIQIDDLLSSIRKEEEITDDKREDSTEVAADAEPEGSKPNENDTEVQMVANGVQNEVATMDNKNDEVANNDKNKVKEVADDGDNDVEIVNDGASTETPADKDVIVESESKNATESAESESADKVEELKSEAKQTGRATPTRASARLNNATPSSIRTRRASRLALE